MVRFAFVFMKGIVIKSTGSWYSVLTESGEKIECRIKGKLRIKGIKSTNPVTVGDSVIFEPEGKNEGIISEIEPRKNYILRRSINLSKQTHIIAANIDQALLIISLCSPKTLKGFIDRFLITAEAYSIPVILVFNKIDLYSDSDKKEMEYLKSVYKKIGYRCIESSVKTGQNLDIIKEVLTDKKTLLSGNSGVGKSSLINVIEPNLNLKVSEISASHQTGKHTTTFAEMHPLSFGGFVIDTPGIKSFGIVDFHKEELYHYFPEFFRLSSQCKFHNCIHINEIQCAVKEATKTDVIAPFRYDNYLKLYYGEDLEGEY